MGSRGSRIAALKTAQLVNSLYRYWEPSPRQPERSGSSVKKILAIIIIAMILLSGGILMVLELDWPVSESDASVRVAVLDSGMDIDFTLQGKVVAQRSFILPQYGYNFTDIAVTDSSPQGTPHGTLVSKGIVQGSSNALLVNAKVMAREGGATSEGLIAAIHWALEQNCTVINLSLGGSPTFGDPLEEAMEYAFYHGAVVVAAGGNSGEGGLAGNSISTPAVYPHCIAVAGLDEYGFPAEYSSRGPTASRIIKPDIAAPGYVETTSAVYFGTSFAAPRVSAGAADIIAYCQSNDIEWTPGFVFSLLLDSAAPMSYASYVVGAGRLDVSTAIDMIGQFNVSGTLPEIAHVHPGSLPMDFERLFLGDDYFFNVQLFSSEYDTFNIEIESETPDVFGLPTTYSINQTDVLRVNITVPTSGPGHYAANISFSTGSAETNLFIDFEADEAAARIAFDISHTPWSIDTTYGQFKELYEELVANDISVTEIRDGSQTSLARLQEFDGVFLLDPCAWDFNETAPDQFEPFSLPFTQQEKEAYEQYYDQGGGIFVAALSNSSLDIASLNDFLNWTGVQFNFTRLPFDSSPTLVTNLSPHPITSGIADFDFVGAPMTIPQEAITLGRLGGRVVLSCLEEEDKGRLVVSGSNFFIDNWGMRGQYNSNENDVLALKITLWITGLL